MDSERGCDRRKSRKACSAFRYRCDTDGKLQHRRSQTAGILSTSMASSSSAGSTLVRRSYRGAVCCRVQASACRDTCRLVLPKMGSILASQSKRWIQGGVVSCPLLVRQWCLTGSTTTMRESGSPSSLLATSQLVCVCPHVVHFVMFSVRSTYRRKDKMIAK